MNGLKGYNANKLSTDATKLLFDYGIDLENRRIWLVEDISDTEFEAVAKAIKYFNDDEDRKHKPVEVIITSNGGCVEVMFAFYDLFRTSLSPIHTLIVGTAASAAVLVAMCGHKRYATANSHLMHHSSKAFSDDLSEKELESRASVIKSMSDRTYRLMAAHSYESEDWWRKAAQQDGERWFTAEEMLYHGIIDGILPCPPVPKIKRPSKPRKKKTDGNKNTKRQRKRPEVSEARKEQD